METLIQAPTEYQKMLDAYVSILEKTNAQLGLWSNPYGVAVGILSLFIALIAIFVAFALWRNSKEQKDRIEIFFSDQEKNIKEKNKIMNKLIKGYELKLENLISKQEEKLKSATKENKIELEKAILELEKEKASIGAYIGSDLSLQSSPATPFVNCFNTKKDMICTNCGKSFSYNDDSMNILSLSKPVCSLTIGDKKVYCPHCGAINYS